MDTGSVVWIRTFPAGMLDAFPRTTSSLSLSRVTPGGRVKWKISSSLTTRFRRSGTASFT